MVDLLRPRTDITIMDMMTLTNTVVTLATVTLGMDIMVIMRRLVHTDLLEEPHDPLVDLLRPWTGMVDDLLTDMIPRAAMEVAEDRRRLRSMTG